MAMLLLLALVALSTRGALAGVFLEAVQTVESPISVLDAAYVEGSDGALYYTLSQPKSVFFYKLMAASSSGAPISELLRTFTPVSYPATGFALKMQALPGLIFFVVPTGPAAAGGAGSQLWVYDIAAGKTTLVVQPGLGSIPAWSSFNPKELTVLDDSLYFVGQQANAIDAVWVVKAGTVIAKPAALLSFNSNSNVRQLTAFNGRIYFAGTTANTGHELWSTDGDSENVLLVKDLNRVYVGTAAPGETLGSSAPDALTVFDSALYFSAWAGGNEQRSLWRTDGTAAGTIKVSSATGPYLVLGGPPMEVQGYVLYFSGWSSSDSSTLTFPYAYLPDSNRTQRLSSEASMPSSFRASNQGGYAYFLGGAGTGAVWRSNVSSTSAYAILPLADAAVQPRDLALLTAGVAFVAYTNQIWAVGDLEQKVGGVLPRVRGVSDVSRLFAWDTSLYFTADVATRAVVPVAYTGLWRVGAAPKGCSVCSNSSLCVQPLVNISDVVCLCADGAAASTCTKSVPLPPAPAPAPAPKPAPAPSPPANVRTYRVSVGRLPATNKSAASLVFYINNVPTPKLTLQRYQTYTFIVNSSCAYPFYLSTSPMGGGAGALVIADNPDFYVCGGASIVFTPSDATPNSIYYQARTKFSMGGNITISPSTSSAAAAAAAAPISLLLLVLLIAAWL